MFNDIPRHIRLSAVREYFDTRRDDNSDTASEAFRAILKIANDIASR